MNQRYNAAADLLFAAVCAVIVALVLLAAMSCGGAEIRGTGPTNDTGWKHQAGPIVTARQTQCPPGRPCVPLPSWPRLRSTPQNSAPSAATARAPATVCPACNAAHQALARDLAALRKQHAEHVAAFAGLARELANRATADQLAGATADQATRSDLADLAARFAARFDAASESAAAVITRVDQAEANATETALETVSAVIDEKWPDWLANGALLAAGAAGLTIPSWAWLALQIFKTARNIRRTRRQRTAADVQNGPLNVSETETPNPHRPNGQNDDARGASTASDREQTTPAPSIDPPAPAADDNAATIATHPTGPQPTGPASTPGPVGPENYRAYAEELAALYEADGGRDRLYDQHLGREFDLETNKLLSAADDSLRTLISDLRDRVIGNVRRIFTANAQRSTL